MGLLNKNVLVVSALLCLMSASGVMAASESTLSLTVTFFEEFAQVIKIKENLYLIEQQSLDFYAANPKSSAALRNVNLIQNTQGICTGNAPPPPTTPPPTLCDASEPAFIVDVIIQLIFQTTISIKAPVTTQITNFCSAVAPNSPPKVDSSTDGYENIRVLMVQFFGFFGISISSGVGLEIYSGIQNSCGAKNQTALYGFLQKAVIECVGLPIVITTTAPIETTTTVETTTEASRDPFTACEQFVDLLLSLCVDIRVQWQLDIMISAFLIAKPNCTAEEKAIFLIECVQKIKTGESGPLPGSAPEGFPGVCLWADFLVNVTVEFFYSSNVKVIEACGICLDICGIPPSVPSTVVVGKWTSIIKIYENFCAFFGFSATLQVIVDMKNILNYPKYSDEQKYSACFDLLLEIIFYCFNYGKYAPIGSTTTNSLDVSTEEALTTAAEDSSTTVSEESSTGTVVPEDAFETCKQFTDLLLLICVDIRVQWQLEIMISTFLSEKPDCTSEEKALFLIECVKKITTGECGPLPETAPEGFPGECQWGGFFVEFTIEFFIQNNIKVIEACGKCLEDSGVTLSPSSTVVIGKWTSIIQIYEHFCAFFGFSATLQVYLDMKNILNYSKYTDEEKFDVCFDLLLEIIFYCFNYGKYQTEASSTESFLEFTEESTLAVEESSTMNAQLLEEIEMVNEFCVLLISLFGDISLKVEEHYQLILVKYQSSECWYCAEGTTADDYANAVTDPSFNVVLELMNVKLREYLVTQLIAINFVAECQICELTSGPSDCVYSVLARYTPIIKASKAECDA